MGASKPLLRGRVPLPCVATSLFRLHHGNFRCAVPRIETSHPPYFMESCYLVDLLTYSLQLRVSLDHSISSQLMNCITSMLITNAILDYFTSG